jgi:hypothetical protein
MLKRQGMARRAALLIGRDRDDVADLRESRGEAFDPLREDPVVVRDEDSGAGRGAVRRGQNFPPS